jgi:MoaA/NifB/PqqE/SkfB family radical SAM enzyme
MMRSIADTKIPLPQTLYLEVTNRCNLKCRTCLQFYGMKERPRDLSLEETKEISRQFPELRRAVLHGIGEPLLNKKLPEIIGYLKSLNVYVLFNSNALLLNKECASQLVSKGLDELRVSLDAGTEKTFARIRVGDGFLKLGNNIEALSQMRSTDGRSTPKISVWMVATRENVEDLPELIKLAARVGIDEVYLQRLVFPTDGPGRGLADKEYAVTEPTPQVTEILRKSHEISRQLKISLMASGLVSPTESLKPQSRNAAPWRQCRRPREVAYITAWGNVLPCCVSPFSTVDYSSLILGNVFDQPFEQIWLGEKYREFRRKHQSDNPPGCCSSCGVEWSL